MNTTEVDFRKLSVKGRIGKAARSALAAPSAEAAAASAAALPVAPSTSSIPPSGSSNSRLDFAIPGADHWIGERRNTAPSSRLKGVINLLNARMAKSVVKTSKVAEAAILYYETLKEFDPFFKSPEPPNPWLSDMVDLWEYDKM